MYDCKRHGSAFAQSKTQLQWTARLFIRLAAAAVFRQIHGHLVVPPFGIRTP